MRCVFLGQAPGQGISRHGTQDRREEDQPAPPPKNCQVVFKGQLSRYGHSFARYLQTICLACRYSIGIGRGRQPKPIDTFSPPTPSSQSLPTPQPAPKSSTS